MRSMQPDSLGSNPALPLTDCLTLDKLFNFSVPQLSHLLNKRRINALSYRIIVKKK